MSVATLNQTEPMIMNETGDKSLPLGYHIALPLGYHIVFFVTQFDKYICFV